MYDSVLPDVRKGALSMGVYIKGMEMPTDDMKNIMILADGRVFQFSGYGNPKPLGTAVPVPPHGRLIDADALVSKIQKALDAQGDSWLKSPVRMAERARCVADFRQIKNAPTIIPAEPCNNLSKPFNEAEEGET